MLQLKNLYKTFNQNTPYEKQLYAGLNLKVEKGDFITIIGSNGAGKSTLFKMITNSIEIDDGSIVFGSDETTHCKEFQTAKRVSSVVQDPKTGTVGRMTVFENLAMAEMKGKNTTLKFCLQSQRRAYYRKLLSQFHLGLEDKLEVHTELLSGGQRQVLSLLMATLNIPELLLLDEHTAALDPKTSEKVMEITEQVVAQHGLTCMMITHKLEDAIRYGNRLIMIHEGQVLMDIGGKEKESLDIQTLLSKYKKVKSSLSDRQLFS